MISMRQVPIRWWPNRIRSAVRAWVQWNRQGRPTDIPIVMWQGRLIANPEGRGVICDWGFDFRYVSGTIHVDDLWDRLSALYPVEREA